MSIAAAVFNGASKRMIMLALARGYHYKEIKNLLTIKEYPV